MNLDQESPVQKRPYAYAAQDDDATAWRYSMAPAKVAAMAIDVREPIPSPTLPHLPPVSESPQAHHATEPASSGFSSPNLFEGIFGSANALAVALPQSQSSSENANNARDRVTIGSADDHADLGRRLNDLGIAEVIADNSHSNGASLHHLSGESPMDVSPESSPGHGIYLSPTAEAAANSARAKRMLLKFDSESRNGMAEEVSEDTSISPTAAQFSTLSPCPDPSAHRASRLMVRRPLSAVSSDVLGHRHNDGTPFGLEIGNPIARATATGSPMAFIRATSRPSTAQSHYQMYPQLASSLNNQHMTNMRNEHFRPGWYYARDPMSTSIQPAYSFSTAASKVTGSDQAPDSRIRDSYKTDTLTALARSQKRFRKNGIGAQVESRGVGKYYQRPSSSLRPTSARSRPGSRQTYDNGRDVRFRSSPPRDSEQRLPLRRKRAMDDSFVVHEDMLPDAPFARRETATRGSDEMMEVDEQTRAAVRMSIFGTNTPEALRGARQGIKELSPNIQIFRKGTQEHEHLRKKRRPSYWDTDLKEIRESPAGRGGVNSPVSAQASMQAEFEVASLPAE